MTPRIKEIIKKNKLFIVDLLLFFLIGLISFAWFRGNNYIDAGDFDFPLDLKKFFSAISFTWDDKGSFGVPNPAGIVALFPLGLLAKTFMLLGLSSLSLEKFVFYFWFVFGGMGTYFLSYTLGGKRSSRLFSGLFYMLNPFSLIIIWRVSHGAIQMAYCSAPFCLALFIKGIKERKGFLYILLASLAWHFLTTSVYGNPRNLVIHWIPIGFYLLSALIIAKKERKFLLRYSLIFIFSWLLLNFYWLFPMFKGMKETMVSRHSPVILSDIETVRLNSVNLINALRMTGYWSLFSGYKGEPYYPYFSYYQKLPIIAISWLIPVLVILGLIGRRLKDRQVFFFFLSIIVFGLFGLNGANRPFGGMLLWLYQKVPSLMMLSRFNFYFYGVPTFLAFSLLAGFGLEFINNYFQKKFSKVAYLTFGTASFVLFFVLVLPLWTGEVVQKEKRNFPGERVKIPTYYFEMEKWLNLQTDYFKILPIPMTRTYNVAFDWEAGYSGIDITRWFAPQTVLSSNNNWNSTVTEAIGNAIEKENNVDISNLLGLLNIKYLLLRNDVRWPFLLGHDWWFAHNPDNLNFFLANQKKLSKVYSLGKLDFYEIRPELVTPLIYSSAKPIWVEGNIEGAVDLAGFLQPEDKESLFFSEQNLEKEELILSKSKKILIWQKPENRDQSDENITRANYKINIPKDGEYEVYLRNDSLADYYQVDTDSLRYMIDSQEIPVSKIVGQNILIALGKLKFKKGNHLLTIKTPLAINLINNPSFENGVWDSIELLSGPLSPREGQILQASDAYEGKVSVNILTKQNNTALFTSIQKFKVGDFYHLSFAAKHLKGMPPGAAIWQNYDKDSSPHWSVNQNQFGSPDPITVFSTLNINPSSQWQQYRLNFTPARNVQAAGLLLFSPGQSGVGLENTENLFDDVRIERIFNNPVLLKLSEQVDSSAPVVSFQKKSPVKYQVSVRNADKPFFLIFGQSYHPAWKLSIPSEHLVANSYANAWYITKTGDIEINLDFTLQRTLSFNLGVSVGALFIFSILALIFTRKK